jgi:hypothetical protein
MKRRARLIENEAATRAAEVQEENWYFIRRNLHCAIYHCRPALGLSLWLQEWE